MSEEMVGQRECYLRGYDLGYFDAIEAALNRAIELGKNNAFQNDGQSGLMLMVTFLNDIKAKRKR